jgi:hypothetical protein
VLSLAAQIASGAHTGLVPWLHRNWPFIVTGVFFLIVIWILQGRDE